MQNKRLLLFALITLIINTLSAQDNRFVLKGQIEAGTEELSGKTIYLKKAGGINQADIITLDSTIIKNNEFSFTGKASPEPTILFVAIGNKTAFFSPESGLISMQIGGKNKINGTPKNNEIQSFIDLQGSITKELKEINDRYSSLESNDENRQSWLQEIQPLRDRLQQGSYTIAKDNIKNDIGEFLIISLYQILSGEQTLELVNDSRPKFRDSETGQKLIQYTQHQNIRQGKGKYLDMTMQTPEGKNVSLSDYVGKGKYVLIDFWASWCGPCIKQMPRLVEIYDKYKDKEFEIIGVSLDDRKQDWTSAINRLNITWVNMSDLKGWKSMAGNIYGITSIPFTLLVDKEGNIIESNLHGEELNYRLQEILD